MGQQEVRFELDFAVPPERLWEALSDHAAMGRWTGATVRLIARGDAEGVGAVRRVRVGQLAIDEEVIYTDAPRRMVYRVVRGAPLSFHRGEILITKTDTGSHLSWHILFVAPKGLGRLAARSIDVGLGRGLRELRGLIGG
jgi:uncharacterized protein YndB with AHSA1/START domain